MRLLFICLLAVVALTGCSTPKESVRNQTSPARQVEAEPLLEKGFVLNVLQHVYRWHFDQSYLLEAGTLDTLEVWARRLHPQLDDGDRSEFAELWIPAVKTRVELKRAEYSIPELNVQLLNQAFKVKRVTRQVHAPASRSQYAVGQYSMTEVREHLFATRAQQMPLSDALRTATRKLIAEYLNKIHPDPFIEDQVLYVAPVSHVCNDVWAFWETGRKLMLFSADVDLANPAFSRLNQMRLEVVDLDKDVVTSTREVPGSNAFVTKDWVGRLFFNCILYGERIARTPEEMKQLRADPNAPPPR